MLGSPTECVRFPVSHIEFRPIGSTAPLRLCYAMLSGLIFSRRPPFPLYIKKKYAELKRRDALLGVFRNKNKNKDRRVVCYVHV